MKTNLLACTVALAVIGCCSSAFAMKKSSNQAATTRSVEAPTQSDEGAGNASKLGSGGGAGVPKNAVWVGQSDHAKSCGVEMAVSLDEMSKKLTTLGVKIYAKKKVRDGKMRIQSCGTDKGDMNGFLISKEDLERAKTLGFDQILDR